MARAAWQATGTLLGSTGADISPVPPAHQTHDILVLLASSRVITETLLTPANYNLLAGPIDVTGWRTYAFWRRALNAAAGNPLCDWSAAVGEKYGQIHTIRGAFRGDPTQSPFANTNGLVGDLTDPNAVAGCTTSVNDQLAVVLGIGSDNLASSAVVTATDPAAFTVRSYTTIATGADAAGWAYSATRATAGATGTVTVDHNAAMPAAAILVAAILDERVPRDHPLVVA